MASSTSRALELLELLESAGTRSVRELADRLHLDERSVRRHIERLREIGIPVDAIRGPGGGYRIASSYRLPPLMLSDQEAIVTLTALTAARANSPQLSSSSALATAIAKIRRSLPLPLAEQVSALLAVVVGAVQETDAIDPSIMLTAADAIHTRRPLALTYLSADHQTERTIQPHDLVAYNGHWYLTGLDSMSRENRTFRLDRVRSLRAMRGTFPAPPPHDVLGDLIHGFATADYRHIVRLRVQAGEDEIRRHLPPSVAELERVTSPKGEPWFRAVIHTESLEWLPRVLLALGRSVVIEEPDELRAVILEQSARLAELTRAAGE